MKKEKKSTFQRIARIFTIMFYVLLGLVGYNKRHNPKIKAESSEPINNNEDKVESSELKYEEFKVIHKEDGNYKDWLEKTFQSDSQIGIILGRRGAGKTAFGIKLLENLYTATNKKCFSIGFNQEELPNWIKVVSDISELQNNSFVLIDEGGILFNSRSSMSNANKLLSQLIMIARHKNLSILFISQNSSNLEVNILRQADFLILKPSSLLQKEFERKIIQKLYESTESQFQKYQKYKGLTYIYSNNFRGFVNNPLPSFWKESISKSFK